MFYLVNTSTRQVEACGTETLIRKLHNACRNLLDSYKVVGPTNASPQQVALCAYYIFEDVQEDASQWTDGIFDPLNEMQRLCTPKALEASRCTG